MTPVVVLVLVAGVSEAAGRLLPVVSRRPGTSPPLVAGLLVAGALVESTVIALWPLTAAAVAEQVVGADGGMQWWTAGLVAPLVLAGVVAFPLLGPLFHLLLLVGVGAGLAEALAAGSGLGWGTAVGCVAAAAVGLALAVEVVRRLVAALIAARVPESVR